MSFSLQFTPTHILTRFRTPSINQTEKTATVLTVVYFTSQRETGGCYRLSCRILKDGGRVQGGRQQLARTSRRPPGLKRALLAARESCILCWKTRMKSSVTHNTAKRSVKSTVTFLLVGRAHVAWKRLAHNSKFSTLLFFCFDWLLSLLIFFVVVVAAYQYILIRPQPKSGIFWLQYKENVVKCLNNVTIKAMDPIWNMKYFKCIKTYLCIWKVIDLS